MGTIKADTVTGLADPNKITLPSGDVTNTTFAMGATLSVGSTTATLNFGNTVIANASAGSSTITGEGGSTTTNLQQGLAKCWVNFDGPASGAASRDSLNVSGMTDNNTGQYRVTYTNNMSDSEYAVTQGADGTNNGTVCSIGFADSQNSGLASTHYDHNSRGADGSGADSDTVITTGSVHGDLA